MLGPWRPRLKRLAKRGAIVLGVVFGVMGVALAVVVQRLDRIVLGQARALGALAEGRLGRPVTVGRAHASLRSTVVLDLEDVTVGPAEGQTGPAAEPLLHVGAIHVGLRAWPLLRSLGEDLQIGFLEVDAPRVTLVREAGGRLSIQDVLDRFGALPRKPMTPEEERRLRALRIGRLAIEGAALAFFDLTRGLDPAAIERLDLGVDDLRLTQPIVLTADAAAFSASPNLHVEVTLCAPFPEAPAAAETGRLQQLRARIAPTELAPLLRFLGVPPAGPRLAVGAQEIHLDLGSARAGGELTLDAADETHLGLTTHAEVTGLSLADAAGGAGVSSPVELDATLSVDALAARAEVKSLDLHVGDMAFGAAGRIVTTGSALSLEALALETHELTFERLLAIVPPAYRPRELALAGPLSFHLAGGASAGEAQLSGGVDLRGASITAPGLHKPAGVPLSMEVAGRASRSAGGAIESFELTAGSLVAHGKGHVRVGGDFDLQLDHLDLADLESLLHLFPGARLPEGATAGGKVAASVEVERKGARTAVSAVVDGTAARLIVPGRFEKSAGVPLHLTVAAEREGGEVTVQKATLAIPGASVELHARTALGSRHTVLDVVRCELDVAALASLVPALAKAPRPPLLEGARARFGLHFEGRPDARDDARLAVHDLDLHTAAGHLTGKVEVVGLDQPQRVSFDLHGDAIDLDALGGGSGGGGPPKVDLGALLALRKLDLDGKLRLASVHRGNVTLRLVEAEVSAARGVVTLKKLVFAAFGGTFSASGSRLDLGGFVPHVALDVHARVDLAEVRAALDPTGPTLAGRVQFGADLEGKGLTPDGIAGSLTGSAKLTLNDLETTATLTPSFTILNPLLSEAAKIAPRRAPHAEKLSIGELDAAVSVHDGRVSTDAPLTATTDVGTLALTGSVGLDRSVDLTAKVSIPVAVIEKATHGKRSPAGPVPVELRVTGELGEEQLEFVHLAATLEAIAGSRPRGAANRVEGALR